MRAMEAFESSRSQDIESHRSLAGADSYSEDLQEVCIHREPSEAELSEADSTGPQAADISDPENPKITDPFHKGMRKLQIIGKRVPSFAKAFWKRFGSYLVYVILTLVVATVVAALGVLTLTASVTLLLVFLITYIVITIVSVGWHNRNESQWDFGPGLALKTIVALLLLSSLIALSVIFRVVSSLKHRSVGGLEIWKGLEIALMSYVFCNICVCGRFILTAVQKKINYYNYKEDWVYFTSKLRLAINCSCFVVASCLCVKVAPSEKSVTFYGFESWKWLVSVVSLLGGWYFIQAVTCFILLALQACQNEFWISRFSGSNSDVQHQGEEEKRSTTNGEHQGEEEKRSTTNGEHQGKEEKRSTNNGEYQGEEEKRSTTNGEHQEEEEKRSTTNGKSYTIEKYAVFLVKGLRTRINILLFFLLIILTWNFYVKPRVEFEKLSEHTKNAINFIIPSFLSLSIAAVLLLIIKFLLLLWEAREVYRRLPERIFEAYIQTYILAKFCRSVGIPKKEDRLERPNAFIFEEDKRELSEMPSRSRSKDVLDGRSQMTQGSRESYLREILDDAINKVINYDILKRAADAFLEEMVESGQVRELRVQWQQEYCSTEEHGHRMVRNPRSLQKKIGSLYGCKLKKKESSYLYQQMKVEIESSTRTNVELEDLEKWMNKAHKDCLELENTLSSAREALGYLNKIMMVFVIVVCIIIWLLLTKIAKTGVIVLVASPILALAFIFGDTVKTMFQGVVFAFAVHPFNVGDVCIIEENQLEVKKIGIWKTTFYRNDSKREEVLYPNSTLINTAIVKHKNILVLDDSIKFSVDFNLKHRRKIKAISVLKRMIKDYLKENKDIVKTGPIKGVDLSSTMEFKFKHRKNFPYMSYSECLLKMSESRSALSQKIAMFIDEVKDKFRCEEKSICGGNSCRTSL